MPKVWEEHLPLVEFAYNDNYHGSVGMTIFEVYDGRALLVARCNKTIDYWTLKQAIPGV